MRLSFSFLPLATVALIAAVISVASAYHSVDSYGLAARGYEDSDKLGARETYEYLDSRSDQELWERYRGVDELNTREYEDFEELDARDNFNYLDERSDDELWERFDGDDEFDSREYGDADELDERDLYEYLDERSDDELWERYEGVDEFSTRGYEDVGELDERDTFDYLDERSDNELLERFDGVEDFSTRGYDDADELDERDLFGSLDEFDLRRRALKRHLSKVFNPNSQKTAPDPNERQSGSVGPSFETDRSSHPQNPVSRPGSDSLISQYFGDDGAPRNAQAANWENLIDTAGSEYSDSVHTISRHSTADQAAVHEQQPMPKGSLWTTVTNPFKGKGKGKAAVPRNEPVPLQQPTLQKKFSTRNIAQSMFKKSVPNLKNLFQVGNRAGERVHPDDVPGLSQHPGSLRRTGSSNDGTSTPGGNPSSSAQNLRSQSSRNLASGSSSKDKGKGKDPAEFPPELANKAKKFGNPKKVGGGAG